MAEKEYKDKVTCFINLYTNRPLGEDGKPISNGECAARAGWARSRCYKTASELLNKPDIQKKIRELQQVEQVEATTGEDTIKSILEGNIRTALKELRTKPDKFYKAYIDFKKYEEEDLGEYNGLSVRELISEIDKESTKAEELKQRVRTEIREEEMSQ